MARRRALRSFNDLDAPVRRAGLPDSPIPPAPALQDALIPSAELIGQVADGLARDGEQYRQER
jgi:pyruvate/2-oxoglutarate/acetoin dehydrogenase E1 component